MAVLAPTRREPGTRARPGTGSELRAVRVVWQRQLIRFRRNRMRIVTSAVQPILFLFVLGTGLSPVAARAGVDYRTFMFPGILAMTVLFTAFFSAVSIVWDREFGFMREMLVAPVSRQALLIGKTLGGATVATVQGLVMVAFAGLVHVPYTPSLILTLVGMMALTAATITAMGVLLASYINQLEAFQAVMQFLVLPMFFLSGAIFPTSQLPSWLSALTKVDPLSYAVDPMRRTVVGYLNQPLLTRLSGGVTWAGWRVPTWLELVVLASVGMAALVGAVARFRRTQ